MASSFDKEIAEAQWELDKRLSDRDDAIYTEELARQRLENLTAIESNGPKGVSARKALSAAKAFTYEKMRAVEEAEAKFEHLQAQKACQHEHNSANEGNPMNRYCNNSGNQGNCANMGGREAGHSDGNQGGMER